MDGNKKLIWLVMDNHCILCHEAIKQSDDIKDTVMVVDRKLLDLLEKDEDVIIGFLRELGKNWRGIGDKFIIKLKKGEKQKAYKKTDKILKLDKIVPYMEVVGDDDEVIQEFGSPVVDYIKKRAKEEP